MNKLTGKVALITGGSTGIGLVTAKLFVSEGATVFITGRHQATLDSAVEHIGVGVTAVRNDVTDLADLDNLFAIIGEREGRLDIVHANAGCGEFAPLGQITEAHYDWMFNTNVKGLIFTVQKALPLMPDGGSIILVASVASVLGTPAFSVYSASKAAVRSLARCWAWDLKDRHIRVNVISPGLVPSPAHQGLGWPDEKLQGFFDSVTAMTPLGRVGTAEEIANAVLFLASDDSSFVNGVELFVDGGLGQV